MYTKGPWEWKDDDRETFGHYRLRPGILASSFIDGTPWGDAIDQANARLIAAAPDLLEALEQSLKALEDHAKAYPHMQKGYTVDAITAAHAAIRKAKGE